MMPLGLKPRGGPPPCGASAYLETRSGVSIEETPGKHAPYMRGEGSRGVISFPIGVCVVPRRPGERFLKANRRQQQEKQKKQDKERGSASARGYSRHWRSVREMKLRRSPLCERCQEEGLVIEATEVHHIIPISDGGAPYTFDNLMSLCHRCHMKIHAGKG